MNHEKKFLSLITILPLLMAVIVVGNFEDANAVTKSEADRLSPKAFGLDKVCGDRLCSEIDKQQSNIEGIDIIDVYPLSGDFYKLLIKIDSSSKSVIDEEIFVHSDIETRILSVSFIKDNSYDYVVTTIRATSAESIEVDYEPYQMIPNLNLGIPQVDVTDIRNISTQDNTYRVIYEVSTDDVSLKNIKIAVSSDADTLSTTIGGLLENNSHTNQVIMKVINPESVNVQVIDFEINR